MNGPVKTQGNWKGHLQALERTRTRFKELGCTATDHGHLTASTVNLSPLEASDLFGLIVSGHADAQQHELFRAQMLSEMARMSVEDGLVIFTRAALATTTGNCTSVMGEISGPIYPCQLITWTAFGPSSTASATNPISPSFSSRWMNRHTAGSSRRWRGTTHVCDWDRPGGSTIVPRA